MTRFSLDAVGNVFSETRGGPMTTRSFSGQWLAQVVSSGSTSYYVYDARDNLGCVSSQQSCSSRDLPLTPR